MAACSVALPGPFLVMALADAPPVAPPAFQPGDISIGEPIALPFGGPRATPPAPPAAPAAVPAGMVPGSGWVGLAVEESEIPGRWRIVEVAPGGPADRAGIAVGDELRAVNGVPLASPEDVSQALTAIAAGQDVPMAVGRADQVRDIVLRADVRPQVRPPEPQRVADEPTPAPAPAPIATATPEPAAAAPAVTPMAAPPAAASPASSFAGVPPMNAEWQSAPTREPSSPQASRFPQPASLPDPTFAPAPLSAPTAPPTPMPAPVAAPPALAAPAKVVPAPGRTALGVRTVPIDPATQARFHLAEQAGAYVVGVVQDLPAAKAGVPPGSVIVALGEQPVRSPLELTRLVTNGPLDRPVTVQFVMPGGESKQAAVRLEALDAPLERALAGPDDTAIAPAQLPRRAERPIADDGPIRAEIRALRSRLERLERALVPGPGGGR